MKYLLIAIFCTNSIVALSVAPKRQYYEIRIYTLKDKSQEEKIEKFLKTAFLPALHRVGIGKVGVFKPVETDTAAYGKRIYVFIPYSSMEHFGKLPGTLKKDKQYEAAATEYLTAPYDNPPYVRMQSILLFAFSDMPQMEVPKLTTPASERIYELRSYEGYTEKIYENKVHMFNEGGEIAIFKRLGFNAMFYGEVLSGNRMPNLMYMTTFENKTSRDAHWKSFSSDPEWKKLSAMPEYQHNVSKIEVFFLHPTEYSDI